MSLHTRIYLTALLLAIASHSPAQLQSTQSKSKQGAAQMTQRANGTFDVKITPQHEDKREGAVLGRMSLHKVFQGDMDGTSEGEMLTAMSGVEGSAVYVAVERFSGTIQGKRGTVALSHRGTMNRGAQELSIEIVPDSGTGELAGIAGSMTIKIENGKHFCQLDYSIGGD
jgi:hypothetical protein